MDSRKAISESYDIFEWATQTATPSEIVPAFVEWLLASPSLERVQQLRERLDDKAFGVLQRGMSEKLLGHTETGECDFEHFSQRFEHLPEEFLKALFGSHYERLQDLAITSAVLFPSKQLPTRTKLLKFKLFGFYKVLNCIVKYKKSSFKEKL